MEKRYQVFVSSTYEDLQEERKAVMQALLELDCIPAGMELFPASSEEQWSLIKRVVDDSDYYLLILAGRYGSCNESGMGYTEMEYQYALETGKPIISFLHRTPGKISADRTEDTPEGKEKLAAFRKLTQKKLVKYWTNKDSLALAVTASIAKLPKQFPAVGWVKADQAVDNGIYKQLLEAQGEIQALRESLRRIGNQVPDIPKDLARGEDFVTLDFWYNDEDKHYSKKTSVSWNYIFQTVSPYLSEGCTADEMKRHMETALEWDEYLFLDINLTTASIQKIRIQLIALGLIRAGGERGVWILTEYGEREMARLLAEHRILKDSTEEAVLV